MQTTVDEQQLKALMKTAVIEAMQEQRGLFREMLEEALEDMALARAIEEGERSEVIDRGEIFAALKGGA